MAKLYFTANGASPTTAPLVKVATGTSTMTMLQIATGTGRQIQVVEWGCSFDGSAAATPIQAELICTGSVAATSMNAGFVSEYNDPNAPAAAETATYWKSGQSEGSVSSVTYADLQLLPPNAPFLKQWPLDLYFSVPVSSYLRVRLTAGASVNAYVYVVYTA